MSELEALRTKIEELRLAMIESKTDRPFTAPEVLSASQNLDTVINQYYAMLRKKNLHAG